MTDALDRLTTLRAEMERKQKEMQEVARAALKEGTEAIFEEYGDILAKFGWAQYTPYFNDGDPCEFGMADLCLIERLPDDASEEERDAAEDEWPFDSSPAFSPYSSYSRVTGYRENHNVDARYDACRGACLQVYEAVAYGDLAKSLFGDHVQVIITADGVEVEDYDHD